MAAGECDSRSARAAHRRRRDHQPARPRTRRRWVHHGSSISHCMEASSPTRTWPVVAARMANVELLNLGLGGNCHLDQFVARTMRDEDADVLSLKVGINVVNLDSLKERTFAPALHGFIDTIREGKPNTPFLIASPIFCPSAENASGTDDSERAGRLRHIGRPRRNPQRQPDVAADAHDRPRRR